jgi:hypothetical protein
VGTAKVTLTAGQWTRVELHIPTSAIPPILSIGFKIDTGTATGSHKNYDGIVYVDDISW